MKISKELVKAYAERKCPKFVYLMSNEKGILKLFEDMMNSGISGDDIIEDMDTSEGEEYKHDRTDSFFELIRLYPDIYDKAKSEINKNKDEVTRLIDSMKDYQEISNLSRLWAVEHFGSASRADTIDGSIDGVELRNNTDIEERTKKLLKDDKVKVILEGQVSSSKSLARWDILVKTPNGYDIYECKGVNSVYGDEKGNTRTFKSQYLYDIAFQESVYAECGLPINSLNFLVINKDFKLSEKEMSYPIDKEDIINFFKIVSNVTLKPKGEKEYVTMSILEYLRKKLYITNTHPDVETYRIRVDSAINLKEEPKSVLCYGCRGCLLKEQCNPDFNPEHILKLCGDAKCGGNWRNTASFIEEGIKKIKEIPDDKLLNGEQDKNFKGFYKYKYNKDGILVKSCAYLQVQSAKGNKTGNDFVEKNLLKQLLKQDYSVFPLMFFDFETFSYPMPIVADTHAWEQVCSQYSMHVVEEDYDLSKHDFYKGVGGGITHYEFLGNPYLDGFKKPERDLLATLQDQFKQSGIDWKSGKFTMVVYNDSFEKSRFREMAEKYPEYHDFCMMCRDRIVDLLHFFTFGYWYRNDFYGRSSLKVTQPSTMNDKRILEWYKDLPYSLEETLDYHKGEVYNGGIALDVYQTMIRMKAKGELSKEVNDNYRKWLLYYCRIDSWGTVILYDIIKKLCEKLDDGSINLDVDKINLL